MKKFIFIPISIVVLIVILLVNPIVTVGAGKRGVVTRWGAVQDRILGEGISLVAPIADNVVKMDVKTQKEEREASSASKDLQAVNTTVAINYRLDPTKVNKIYQSVGNDYAVKIVDPAIQEYIKSATSKYTAEELITKREQVKEYLQTHLKENLAKNDILLEDVFITDFKFSDSFDKAIESKVTAEQRALESKNKLEQVKFEAEQQIATAKAEAESIRIKAQAVTQQGGADYVKLQAIQKWDGKLPVQMIPGSAVPFIDLK
jgi:regulator of protease activity HflC (stomatin/prohibitin superfamily)